MSRVRLIIDTMLAHIDLHHEGMEYELFVQKQFTSKFEFSVGRKDLILIYRCR